MKRGDIYRIEIYDEGCTGSEMRKSRPGVIVSNDALNSASPVVTVVYLTATAKRTSPSHVEIESAPLPSTALCEQIYTVDKSRLTHVIGEVTSEELADIDTALRRTLALVSKRPEDKPAATVVADGPADALRGENIRLRAKLELYEQLYGNALDRLIKV